MDLVLKPQQLDLYRNSNKEPQYVTTKEPNRAMIYLESSDCKLETNLVSMNCSTMNSVGEYPSTLAYGVTRVSQDNMGVRWAIPNVNVRNNTFRFYSAATSSFHSVDLVEGYYATSAALITHIVNRLNSITGSSGLTFSYVSNPLFPDRYDLDANLGYYFDLGCSAVVKGYKLYCLPVDQIATTTKVVGAMGLFYTTYVDVCSNTLTKYVKLRTTSTSKTPNLVSRMHLIEPYVINKIIFMTSATAPDIQMYYSPSDPINSIDIELRDEFGDLLYVPTNADGTFRGFWWSMALTIEC